MTRFISEKEKYDIISLAENLISGKESEIKVLREIVHNATYNNIKRLHSKIRSFSWESESNFLEGKRLAMFIHEGKDCSTYDYKAMGTSDTFPCTLTCEDEIWEFTLPIFASTKLGASASAQGICRYTGYLIKNLIEKYKENIGDILTLSRPVVIFEYGINDDPTFAELYDADNKENKKALDSLTGTFFSDDNVINVTTIYYGVYTETPYTKIIVMETARFLQEMAAIEDGKTSNSPLGRIQKK